MGRDEDFDESSYVKVNTRLSQFRKDNPEGAIQTQRIGEDGGVIFKCLVFRNSQDIQNYGVAGVAPAAGHSYLPDWARDDDQKVEEYAETVAIGRALACLGYSVDKSIASAEEMNKYQKMYGEEPKDDEEEESSKKTRRPRKSSSSKAASKKKKKTKKSKEVATEEEEPEDSTDEEPEEDSGETPKLASSSNRNVKRGSRLSGRKRRNTNKGDDE